MPRPKKDGSWAEAPNRRKITEMFLQREKPKDHAHCVWDTLQRGLCVLIQPTGHKAWKCVYAFHGRPRWVHIGDAAAVGLQDARRIAAKIMSDVADGKDPLAVRRAERGRGTFEELAARYLDEYARGRNRSWAQARALVERNLLPRWGRLSAGDITRADVKAMMGRIEAPVAANMTLAAASAIFSWAMRQDVVALNPCAGVERNPTKSRERVLSDTEIPKFWRALDSAPMAQSLALKFILLTGQRPGEVSSLRWEHVEDGWWTLPGAPIESLGWPGTKNGASHRIWIPGPAKDIMAEASAGEEPAAGFVFPGARNAAVDRLDGAMRDACAALGAERATPHDLRRTHGTMIASLGFGRDAMNRIQNHKEGGIASVYDRHEYAEENKKIMKAVAARIMSLVDGTAAAGNVVAMTRPR